MWKGVTALASFVRDTSQDIREMAKQTTSRAVFEVPEGARLEKPVVIPAGLRVRAGDREFQEGVCQIKDLATRASTSVPLSPSAEAVISQIRRVLSGSA